MGPGYIFTGPEGEPWQAEGPIWSVAIQFPRPLKMGQLVSPFHGLTPFFLFCFPLSFIYSLVFFHSTSISCTTSYIHPYVIAKSVISNPLKRWKDSKIKGNYVRVTSWVSNKSVHLPQVSRGENNLQPVELPSSPFYYFKGTSLLISTVSVLHEISGWNSVEVGLLPWTQCKLTCEDTNPPTKGFAIPIIHDPASL